jgi:hypothetical protein
MSGGTRCNGPLNIRLDILFELTIVLGSCTPVTGPANGVLGTQIGTCCLRLCLRVAKAGTGGALVALQLKGNADPEVISYNAAASDASCSYEE